MQGRKRPHQPPTVWGMKQPCGQSTILVSRGMLHRARNGATARGQQPATKTHVGDTRRTPLIGGRGPEKRSFSTSGDRKEQGHRVRRGTAAPVMVMPVVRCLSLGPLPLGTLCSGIFIHCPLVWQWGRGVCWARQPATGCLVRLVSLTRLTCRPAPHLKRVWSAGSFR